MLKIRRILLTITIFIMSIFLISCEDKYLNPDIPSVYQQETQWCWNAASIAVLSHYGINMTQDEFAYKYAQNMENTPKSSALIKSYLYLAGLDSQIKQSKLELTDLRSKIDSNSPVLLGQTIINSNGSIAGGHELVVRGYSKDDFDFFNTIYYMDPWDGTYKAQDYDNIVMLEDDSNNKYYWVDSIYSFVKK